jgi:hypothetical protein
MGAEKFLLFLIIDYAGIHRRDSEEAGAAGKSS